MTKTELENETNAKSPAMDKGDGVTMSQGRGPAMNAPSGTGNGKSAPATAAKSAGSGHDSDAGVLAQVQKSGKDIASKSLKAIGEKTLSTTEGYKSEITGGLNTLADGLRKASTSFEGSEDKPLASAGARYIGDLAEKIESVSGYFERNDATALFQDVKGFARRNPTVFVGGAFALGFALSRMIRSTAATQTRG
ncbi:MAG: hypothetical protein ABIR33_08855 [Pyrinomonadaceae bacterium]